MHFPSHKFNTTTVVVFRTRISDVICLHNPETAYSVSTILPENKAFRNTQFSKQMSSHGKVQGKG
jgi:hypothetical protein